MVEKFNFYDIYGYLIPGLVLIGLAWIPMGLLWGQWPKQEIASAILLLLLAYLLGHLIQGLSYDILPSSMTDSEGHQRYPSNVLLDATDTSLDQETKKRIRSLSTKHFDINLDAQGGDLRRAAVFFQARSALLKQKGDKGAAYWEQFEGLYAMTRNVSLAMGIGAFYMWGWALALAGHFDRFYVLESRFALALVVLSLIAMIITSLSTARTPRRNIAGSKSPSHSAAAAPKDRKRTESAMIARWIWVLSLALIALAAGSQIALSRTENHKVSESKAPCDVCCIASAPDAPENSVPSLKIERPGLIMSLLGLAVLLATLRMHRAFKSFAKEFALAVWRDFANFEIATGEAALPTQQPKT
ncbi:MAG TPA: hypothetical protein VK574_13520 [Terracidiphilus sp.]|nr:hypothetical protein [Terracidiphilus sp.]